MTEDAEIVLARFARLSEEDQKEVAEAVGRHQRSTHGRQATFAEDWEKRGNKRILMGPVSGTCPCCNR